MFRCLTAAFRKLLFSLGANVWTTAASGNARKHTAGEQRTEQAPVLVEHPTAIGTDDNPELEWPANVFIDPAVRFRNQTHYSVLAPVDDSGIWYGGMRHNLPLSFYSLNHY